MTTFVYRSPMPVSPQTLFDWHAQKGAFRRLTPPWEKVRIREQSGHIRDGSRVVIETTIGPIRQKWIAEHCDYVEGKQFRDIQIAGPFARWEHIHRMLPNGESSILEDRVDYDLPFGLVGKLLAGRLIHLKLQRIFQYRHAATAGDLHLHTRYHRPPLRIALTGSTGFLGATLEPLLSMGGHDVLPLVRIPGATGERTATAEETLSWNPQSGEIHAWAERPADAVIHLAAENIGKGKWTAAKKQAIHTSRGDTTRQLCRFLAEQSVKPRVLVCASAVGYYGDRADTLLDETSEPGHTFLAQVCREWEAATAPARQAGIRVVNLRIGVVLAPDGGALKRLLTPFRYGLGGPIGHGEQYISWISKDDAISAIYAAVMDDNLTGPVNVCAPKPVTSRELARTLGRILHRPAGVALPQSLVRAKFGEMADEVLLASARLQPAALLRSGFTFRHPDLESALKHLLPY